MTRKSLIILVTVFTVFGSMIFFSSTVFQKVNKLDIYYNLGSLDMVKHFPVDDEAVRNCLNHYLSGINGECNTFRTILQAKKSLISQGKNKALSDTFKEIKGSCAKLFNDTINTENKDYIWTRCSGALTSLYFFNTKDTDHKILTFFKVEKNLFKEAIMFPSVSRAWFTNRILEIDWDRLINTLDFGNPTKSVDLESIKKEASYYTERVELLMKY